jgi:hypothetical protein
MPTAVPHHHNSDNESHSGSGGHVDTQAETYSRFSPDNTVEEVIDFPSYFNEVGGRLFHASQTSPYPLPVDTPEQDVSNALPIYVAPQSAVHPSDMNFSAIEGFQWSHPSIDWRQLRRAGRQCSGTRVKQPSSRSSTRPVHRDWNMVSLCHCIGRSQPVTRWLTE